MELGGQQVGVQRRQVGGDPDQPLSQVSAGHPHPNPRASLLPLQGTSLVRLGDLGRDDVEHTSAQHPQLARSEVGRLLDQVALRRGAQLPAGIGGQRVQRGGDRLRLRPGHSTRRQGRGEHGVPLVERLGQTLQPHPLGPVESCPHREPGSGGPGGLRLGHVARGRQHGQPHALQPRDLARQPEQHLPLGGSAQVDRAAVGSLVDRRRDRGRAPLERVRQRDGDLAHDTDARRRLRRSRRPRRDLWTERHEADLWTGVGAARKRSVTDHPQTRMVQTDAPTLHSCSLVIPARAGSWS